MHVLHPIEGGGGGKQFKLWGDALSNVILHVDLYG